LQGWGRADCRFEDIVTRLAALKPDVMCIMHTSPNDTGEAIDILRKHWSGPIATYPECGYFKSPDWEFVDVIAPADLVAGLARLADITARQSSVAAAASGRSTLPHSTRNCGHDTGFLPLRRRCIHRHRSAAPGRRLPLHAVPQAIRPLRRLHRLCRCRPALHGAGYTGLVQRQCFAKARLLQDLWFPSVLEG
jgi:hypothetical protein